MDQRTVVSLPPDLDMVRLARLVATGVGHGAGMGVDEVEDLRIATDEACCILLERRPPAALELSFAVGGGRVDVHVSCPLPRDRTVPAGFGADVLGAVTHAWDWRDDGRCLTLHFEVRVAAPPRNGAQPIERG